MKKLFFPTIFFAAVIIISLVSYKHSVKFQRLRYESFLKNKYWKLSPHKTTRIDEYAVDQPEMAALQDYFETLDPETGTVPRQRLLTAYSETKTAKLLKPSGSDLQWTGYPAVMGGRTRTLMFDPNDPNHKKVWAGGVTGGLWYNTDITNAYVSWVPVGDFWSCLSIRCITSDPIHPLTFYVGTGEPETAMQTYRESSGLGDGIWKSTDGGQTWNVLPSTLNFAYISKIIVRNEAGNSVIYAGVVSGLYHGIHQTLPSDGLFRSDDGGNTWQQVLPDILGKSVPYSPSDVVINSNGRIFVGTMPNLENNGAATILYSDAGTIGSWTVNETFRNEIIADTAKTIPGRVVFACAPSDPNVVYALIAQGFNNSFNGFNYFYCYRIYRSGNQGISWARKTLPWNTNGQPNFAYLAWHALDVAVDPNNADNVFIGGLDVQKTNDGGNSWDRVTDWSLMYSGGGPQYVHGDQHVLLFKPGSSDELVLGTDGGVFYTTDATSTEPFFEERNNDFNTLQFYTGAIHPVAGTEEFLGGLQDNGTLRYTGTPLSIYSMVSGGDGAFCFYDKDEPNYSITSVYYNQYFTFDNGGFQNYITDFYQSGVFVNPADYDNINNTLYANACDFVGNYLDNILRINDITTYYGYYGSFVPVNTGAQVYFSALKWSPYSPSGNTILYLGTQSGQLFRIQHAESNPVSTEITGSAFPVANLISIDVHGSEDTLLVTFSNYGISSVFVSYNRGQSWHNREGNLPDMPVRWGIFHPQNSKQAMLATETGIWTTTNLNEENVIWTPEVEGLANVRIDMLNLREADNTVLAATHGRGFFTAIWDVISGIKNVSKQDFFIYPNPTRDFVNISCETKGITQITVKIYDQTGKIVYEEMKKSAKENWTDQINLVGKPDGIYYITLYENGQKSKTVKIIKG
jgi:photosystem II stability/assembly factor-like uncharacterized protein